MTPTMADHPTGASNRTDPALDGLLVGHVRRLPQDGAAGAAEGAGCVSDVALGARAESDRGSLSGQRFHDCPPDAPRAAAD